MANTIRCDIATLAASLTEALALADVLDLPLVAIHLDQAIAQLGPPLDMILDDDVHPAQIGALQ